MRETRWRVVEADGRAYPPNSDPLRSYEVAERRLAYYTKMTRAGGDDARLPKLPLSLEWCQVEAGPWNGVRGGLDLVSPPDPPIPPAASPDERLREAAQVAVFACLPVLHIVGSQNRGYRVSDVIDPKVIADPQEWVDAAHAICELHHVLAAADRDSGDVAIERLGNAVIEANRRGPIPPVSDDPDFLAADRDKPDEPHTQDCQDAMFMHHAATGGDMECTCRPPVSDDPVNDPETDT